MRRTKIIDGDTPLLGSRYVRGAPLSPSFNVITNLGMHLAKDFTQLPRLFTPPRKCKSIPRRLASHVQHDNGKRCSWCCTKPLSCSPEHVSYRQPHRSSVAEYHSIAGSAVTSSTAHGYNINSILRTAIDFREKTTINKREHAHFRGPGSLKRTFTPSQ